MQNKNNEIKLLTFGFLASVVASMAFMTGSVIQAALAQGTNGTSSSGMNMTGTGGGGATGGSTNNTTVTRDTVTILLEGKSIPGMGFLHLYDSTI
jgi:hypothetical protein